LKSLSVRIFALIAILVACAVVLSACAPATTPDVLPDAAAKAVLSCNTTNIVGGAANLLVYINQSGGVTECSGDPSACQPKNTRLFSDAKIQITGNVVRLTFNNATEEVALTMNADLTAVVKATYAFGASTIEYPCVVQGQ